MRPFRASPDDLNFGSARLVCVSPLRSTFFGSRPYVLSVRAARSPHALFRLGKTPKKRAPLMKLWSSDARLPAQALDRLPRRDAGSAADRHRGQLFVDGTAGSGTGGGSALARGPAPSLAGALAGAGRRDGTTRVLADAQRDLSCSLYGRCAGGRQPNRGASQHHERERPRDAAARCARRRHESKARRIGRDDQPGPLGTARGCARARGNGSRQGGDGAHSRRGAEDGRRGTEHPRRDAGAGAAH